MAAGKDLGEIDPHSNRGDTIRILECFADIGFRFGKLTDYRDVSFLPGGAKYGDVPGLLALNAPGKLWVGGETAPALTSKLYSAANAAGSLTAAAKTDRAAAAKWLLAQNPLTLKFAIRGLVASPFHEPEMYRRIKVPTMVLAHEGDGLHPVRSATLLAEMIPDCTLRVAPEAEYWREHPEEVAAEVERFIERVG